MGGFVCKCKFEVKLRHCFNRFNFCCFRRNSDALGDIAHAFIFTLYSKLFRRMCFSFHSTLGISSASLASVKGRPVAALLSERHASVGASVGVVVQLGAVRFCREQERSLFSRHCALSCAL